MSAHFPGRFIRTAIMLGCALLGFFSSIRFAEAQRTSAFSSLGRVVPAFRAAAEISNTPAPAKKLAVQNSQPALEPGTKRRARFLGAVGLVIISVLVLATGIALLRSF